MNGAEQLGTFGEGEHAGVCVRLILRPDADRRPVNLFRGFVRWWSKARSPEVRRWFRENIKDGEVNLAEKRMVSDPVWRACCRASVVHDKQLMAAEADWDISKCFERVLVSIVFHLAQHQGMPTNVIRPLRSMYENLQRRLNLGGHIGDPFKATDGILQGCPLSVLLLSILMNVWAQAVRAEDASL